MKQYITLIIVVFLPFAILFGQERPNILWITIEDTSPQFIGCYGNQSASTPIIDRLAKEGVMFTNAFSTGTVCSPSRSTIITGVPTYKLGTGNHRSAYSIPEYIKGFPTYLREAGYYTSNNFKTDYNVAEQDKMIEASWNESSRTAGWWNRDDDQPFFSVFNFNDSHQSRTMTMPFEWYENNVLKHLKKDEIISDDAFDMPPFYKDTPAMRREFARVYNAIKLTDHKIGELLKRLEEDGLMENTIIFIFADHGEGIPRGKTNGINLGYRVPFIIKIPPKYQNISPWLEQTEEELVSFEDLAPTVLSIAGIKIPEYLKGRILMGQNRSEERKLLFLSSDRADNGIDMVRTSTDGQMLYSKNFMPFMPEVKNIRYVNIGPITQEMRKDLKLMKMNELQETLFKVRPDEILYDIHGDLWETKNLIDIDTNKAKVLRQNTYESMIEYRDLHLLPEYMIAEISQNEPPYEWRLKQENFDPEKILEIAKLVGVNTTKSIAELAVHLTNENPAISYWSGVGLFSAPPDQLTVHLNDIEKAMDSEHPLTRAYSSAIMYRDTHSEKAEMILNEMIHHTDVNIALQTVNLLLYLDDITPFIGAVQKLEATDHIVYKLKAAALDFLTIAGLEDPSRQN
ncbi:sulfatase family protein [Portibacter marinus]|uniref:sulfatase family protein n=1 Tax=Portibacter marinus TaxID=2898660 RepID=UPI001F325DE9|nr:sulfatase [Portibacter marinus]